MLGDLHFVRPQWLWALLAVPLLALWWYRRRGNAAWTKQVDPHLLPHLVAPASRRSGLGRVLLGLSIFALAVLALAGPGWRQQEQPVWQEAAPLVIALDLSSATLAEDLQPSRLLQARAAIDRILQQRAGGEVALVVFAGGPHTVAPLTGDAGNVRLFLDALAPDIMPTEGSRPERAIEWAVQLLEQAGFDRGEVLLLTHDAGPAARRAASAAARKGHRVSVLGLGTAVGAPYRDATGRLGTTRMEAGALQALASAGGGRFIALADGDPAGVLQASPGTGGERGGRGQVSLRSDQGYWLLLPLMLLAALAFRRGALLPLLALAVCLPLLPGPARAADGGLWKRADQEAYERALGAVEAYRSGEHERAARAWEQLPGADAAYNRGNALARAGKLEEALAAYDEALALEPAMEDAIVNRDIVRQALQQQPPTPGQGEPEAGGDGDDEGEAEDAQGGRGDGREPPGEDPQESPAGDATNADQAEGADAGSREPGEQPPETTDPDAQRQADQALREQMQQALAQEGSAGDAPEAEAAAVEEAERRAAADAWLRRIPDDPGGLLRARFRLEHERRRSQGAD